MLGRSGVDKLTCQGVHYSKHWVMSIATVRLKVNQAELRDK